MKSSFADEKTSTRIDEDIIRKVVAKITSIPVEKLNKSETKKILSLEKNLNKQIISQEEAVHSLVRSIIRSKAEIKDKNRPLGSYLFLGPTGVGKTLLAKKLSEEIFGLQKSLIQIDMSEYMEKFSLSRLIGAPPGYVGFQEGGELTEKVKRNPYSVVLFDEIEKAHPDISNLLLQILEEGVITDSEGNKVNFSHTIIILTSNVGASLIHNKGQLGFLNKEEEKQEHINKNVKREAEKFFQPEFINRLDEVVIFKSLNQKALLKIITLELQKTNKRLERKKIKLRFTPKVKKFILQATNKREFGARPIRRTIEQTIENKLAELVLAGKLSENSTVCFDIEKDRLTHKITL